MPGGACPNASGQCSTPTCSATEASIWYGKKGNKYCKGCYDKKSKEGAAGKRPRVDAELLSPPSPTPTVTLSHGSDAWISEIYAVRSHRYRSPAPRPPSTPSMPPARGADRLPPCVGCPRVHREFDHTKLEEWEQRNDAFDRVAMVEYLVHAKVHVHELDEEGKKAYVWADLDTLLASAPVVDMDPEELSDMVLAYEKRGQEARAAAFQTYAHDVPAAAAEGDAGGTAAS